MYMMNVAPVAALLFIIKHTHTLTHTHVSCNPTVTMNPNMSEGQRDNLDRVRTRCR